MKYRAEIDGLRALAVVPVILFHAGFEMFSGGFVGVDVFFVISGYLITNILIEDLDKNQFSILHFYERRARRILPALFFVMFACLPFAWIWMLPNQMKDFSQSLIAVSLFSSNILFWRESGYFAAASEEKPLLHTWSLAVEEQYYLVFPIIFFLIWRFGKDRSFLIVSTMALVSLLISEWGWRNQPTANFYLSPTRAWELLAGSMAAFVVQERGVRNNQALSLLGLAAILFSIFAYDESTPFPSSYAVIPVLGVFLIVLFAGQRTIAARLLSTNLFVFIGLISYSAYLWHQPLFSFTRIRLLEEPSKLVMATLSATSLVLAVISQRYVENPFRQKNAICSNHINLLLLSFAGLLCFILIGLLGHFTQGFRETTLTRLKLAQVEARTEENYGMSRDCEGDFNLSSNCANSETPTLLLWGDSFAMHLYQGIIASNPNVQIRQHTSSSCSPILGYSRLNASEGLSWAQRCILFNNSVFEWLTESSSIEFVVLSSPFHWISTDEIMDEEGRVYQPSFDLLVNNFSQTIRKIRSLGVGVVLVSPTPRSGFDIGKCLSITYQHLDDIICDFNYSDSSYSHDFVKEMESSVNVYWLHNDICEFEICRAEIDGIFIYQDTGHLSKEGSFLLGLSNNWYKTMRKLAFGALDSK